MVTLGRSPLKPGSKVQGYRIKKKIGQGGFGLVYEAYHPILKKKAAVKEYFPQNLDSARDGTRAIVVDDSSRNLFDKFLKKFRETTGKLANLDHKNIVDVYGYEDAFGTGYLIMELIEGRSLSKWRAGERVTRQKLIKTLRPIFGALSYLHSEGVFHRDISPYNIMVRADGEPVLIDFGALKQELIDAGRRSAVSTVIQANPDYAPIEQLPNEMNYIVGAYSDVFSLAATIYVMVSRDQPMRVESRLLIKAAENKDPYISCGENARIKLLPHEIAAVDKALSLLPKDRYQTIAEFSDALKLWPVDSDSTQLAVPVKEETATILVVPKNTQSKTQRIYKQIGKIVGRWLFRDIHHLQIPSSGSIFDSIAPGAFTISSWFVITKIWKSFVDRILSSDKPSEIGDDNRRVQILGASVNRKAETNYSEIVVRIPEDHHIGRIEAPENFSFFSFKRWRDPKNEEVFFQFEGRKELDQFQFLEIIAANKRSSGLVFVHGFNNSEEDAYFRLAQIVFDTQYKGQPFMFSWQSADSIAKYKGDRDAANIAFEPFIKFLQMLQDDTELDEIHVLAHSMGNWLVLNALSSFSFVHQIQPISELVMAHPDVDADLYQALIDKVGEFCHGMTLYASRKDFPLWFSGASASGPAVGALGKAAVTENRIVDPIDISTLAPSTIALNHSTFAEHRSMVDDIGRLIMKKDRPPHERSPQVRGVPEGSSQPDYWQFVD